jgi:hypothetical protein
MKWKRVIAMGILAAAGALGVDDAKLCLLIPDPDSLGLKTGFNYTPEDDGAMLYNPYSAACGMCRMGVGSVSPAQRDTPGPKHGFYVQVVHFASDKGARYEAGFNEHKIPSNSKDFGDTAVVMASATEWRVRFARGSYHVEIFGRGSYRSRAAAVARHIDEGLRKMPADCEASAGKPATLPPDKAPTPATSGAPARPPAPGTSGAPARPPAVSTAGGAGKAAACFSGDATAALLDGERHRAMASRATQETIMHTLDRRLRTINGCGLMTADQRTTLNANISVAIAKRVREARCFAGDTTAIDPDWNFHKNRPAPGSSIDNLIFKARMAVTCLQGEERNAFFAEAAMAIASALDR